MFSLKTRFSMLHRSIVFRSGGDFRFVLVGWQDKRHCGTPSVRKEKECIGDAGRGLHQTQDTFGSVADAGMPMTERCGRDGRNLRHVQDTHRPKCV